ncbi:MAG: Formyltransferase/hydrolase complex Fhc subunit [Planctomycetota bacterium]|jgi:formylmethanofuran dehydrogenase subunit A
MRVTRLKNVRIVDGLQGSSRPTDLYILDKTLARKIPADLRIDADYDLENHVVMAGGIDIHTHIGGGKVNLARLLWPERSKKLDDQKPWLAPLSAPVPGTWETGRRYLQMGYTTCFEPAMLPANARQSHLEMRDTPWLDTGGYVVLGNDRMLLNMLASRASQQQVNDYVAWMVVSSAAMAIKVVNAGGIDAFKFNQRQLNVDEAHPQLPVTPREILWSLSTAAEELGLAHPLHVHCSNLGTPGNIDSTLATLDAVEGRRIHLTHAQYHCYGKSGPHGFSSEASKLADRVNRSNHISIDVGQVLFGQTITLSADTMHQFANRKLASPRKQIFQDLECQAGCGLLPFKYKESQYVHGLQWAIGLELFLRIQDPKRVFLTTDHPNGGPFTGYPHLIRLLMDYDFRMSIFDRLHPDVKATSSLPSLKREYRLDEIASITRLGPARALGLQQRGHLSPGSIADVVVYRNDDNAETMFANPVMVFRRGQLVLRNGEILDDCPKTVLVSEFETRSDAMQWGNHSSHREQWEKLYGYSPWLTALTDQEFADEGLDVEHALWQPAD